MAITKVLLSSVAFLSHSSLACPSSHSAALMYVEYFKVCHLRLCLFPWSVSCHAANQQLLVFSDRSGELENEEWSFHSSSHYWTVVLHATLSSPWLIVSEKHILDIVDDMEKDMCPCAESSVSIAVITNLITIPPALVITALCKVLTAPNQEVDSLSVLLLYPGSGPF